jgi:hypothetical protein
MGKDYNDAKNDILNHHKKPERRYKVFVPVQVTATQNLVCGEELFIKIMNDFNVRRGFAVWLSPDRSSRSSFSLSPTFAKFMLKRREVSALAIDSLALHPSADPSANSINARLLTDLLFRV